MPLLNADYILTPEGLLAGWVLDVNESGNILDLRIKNESEACLYFPGILTPGFVNAHCHLELSALEKKIPEGKGMTAFIREVVALRRQITAEESEAAAEEALTRMYRQGVQVLGDISNDTASLSVKRAHPEVFIHTFVEMLGLIPSRAEAIVASGKATLAAFQEAGLAASLTLHAPYSVSVPLRDLVYAGETGLRSLHLLESQEEVLWFVKKDGPFGDFFAGLGVPAPDSAGNPPEKYLLQGTPTLTQGLLVHLTEASEHALAWLAATFPWLYFCLCPRSNAYLHGTLPNMHHLHPYLDRICFGTDSLASCPDLDVLQEAATLKQAFPHLKSSWLLQALTAHGANALGLAEKFGSFRPGTSPGVIQIRGIEVEENTWNDVSAHRIY